MAGPELCPEGTSLLSLSPILKVFTKHVVCQQLLVSGPVNYCTRPSGKASASGGELFSRETQVRGSDGKAPAL